MWNVGCILHSCRATGNCRVYVDISGWASSILYGLMYFEHSFLAQPLGRFRFFVDKYTISHDLRLGSATLFLLAWWVWKMWLSMITSCASARLASACCANFQIPGGVLSCGWYSFSINSRYPPFNSNRANWVIWPMLAFITNLVMSTRAIQSFWLRWISTWNICPMDQFIHCHSICLGMR